MHGVGRATAALTVVNALPTGIGCALGIDLATTVEVELRGDDGGSLPRIDIPDENRTPLVEVALRTALSRYVARRPRSVEMRVRSQIPMARGLKSSSAVASAIVRAVARAAGVEAPPLEVARLSAEAGRESGVSATGAFDDALAGLTPGFCLTNNRDGTLLDAFDAGVGWEAAVLIPPGSHRPSPAWSAEFAAVAPAGAQIVDVARRRDYWTAMDANSALVERVMGYEYSALRAELRSEGALGAGVSGLGPALAAVAPSTRIPRLLEILSRAPGDRLRVAVAGASSPSVRRSS